MNNENLDGAELIFVFVELVLMFAFFAGIIFGYPVFMYYFQEWST